MRQFLYILVVNILLVSSTSLYGQYVKRQGLDTPSPSSSTLTPSYAEIKIKAKATADALIRRDYNTVADHTYPKVVRLAGGRANTALLIQEEMRKVEQKGYKVLSIQVGEPEKFQIIGKQIFSVVPMAMTMKTPIGNLLNESFLLAISEDGSRTWTFIDGALAVDRRAFRQILPFAANRLQLPPKKRPVLIETSKRSMTG